MTKTLTDEERLLLGYLCWYHRQWGYMPSLREMAHGLDLHSTSKVERLLRELERKGRVARTARVARALVVVEGPREGED